MLLVNGWAEGEGLGMDVRGSKGFEFVCGGEGEWGSMGLDLLWIKIKKGKFTSSFTSPDFFKKKFLLWIDCKAKKEKVLC